MGVAILATADAVLRDTPIKADDDELVAGPVLIPRSREVSADEIWLRLHAALVEPGPRKGIAVENIRSLAFEIAIVLEFGDTSDCSVHRLLEAWVLIFCHFPSRDGSPPTPPLH